MQFGLGQTLGLHAVIGLLRHFLGEIGATNANILDIEAEGLRIAMQVIAHFRHHRGAFIGQRRFKAAQTVNPAQ